MLTHRPTIRQLPTSLINKIAAGEVIERPASVVKEMLENSIDSGATRIELSVEKGGTELIRIADNGCGIEAEQLTLAIAPHATSKLVDAEDLFTVMTLGFRGEALASIAEISHLIIRSRPEDSENGHELEIRGGQYTTPVPCAASVGTSIEVRNLFFNTPVRRKFLKSSSTEMGHITEAFTRIAVAYPNVHMLLRSGERIVHDLSPTDDFLGRIRKLYGDEIADSLIPVESQIDATRVQGYVANPNVSRSNNRMQYLFLNGRYIKDRALQHALGEAYRSLLMVGRFPICFLHLTVPPNEVDVNVHPTKTEVRFTDSGRLYSQLLSTLRKKFLSSDLSNAPLSRTTQRPDDDSDSDHRKTIAADATGNTTGPASPGITQHADQLLQWARGKSGGATEFQPFPDNFGQRLATHREMSNAGNSPSQSRPEPVSNGPATQFDPNNPAATAYSPPAFPDSPDADASTNPSGAMAWNPNGPGQNDTTRRYDAAQTPSMNHLGFQLHNRYLITEDSSGMVVIDQHALHERVIYEQIRVRVLNKSLETQRLLVPEPVSLTASEAADALASKDLLAEVGIEIEPFGGDTIAVTAYPAMLANIQPGDMVRQLLESIAAEKKPEPRELVDSLLHMIACKAAIKAGDKLTPEEITALLEQRDHYQDTHHCPHGRPTALFFSRDHLDKLFKRT
jgi:DNA mismatch repair protein MutL